MKKSAYLLFSNYTVLSALYHNHMEYFKDLGQPASASMHTVPTKLKGMERTHIFEGPG